MSENAEYLAMEQLLTAAEEFNSTGAVSINRVEQAALAYARSCGWTPSDTLRQAEDAHESAYARAEKAERERDAEMSRSEGLLGLLAQEADTASQALGRAARAERERDELAAALQHSDACLQMYVKANRTVSAKAAELEAALRAVLDSCAMPAPVDSYVSTEALERARAVLEAR